MKKSFLLLLSIFLVFSLVLVACGDSSDEAEPGDEVEAGETAADVDGSDDDSSEQEDESDDPDPEQEKLNEQLKKEAVEANFVELNSDDAEDGKKVFAVGEITNIQEEGKLGKFTLTTEEENGNGMYTVNSMTVRYEPKESDRVKVYGSYDGKDETGMPIITATIIEPTEKEKGKKKASKKEPKNTSGSQEAKKHYDRLNQLYSDLQEEYEVHKNGMDDAAWGEFARNWKDSVEEVKEDIESADYDKGLKFSLGAAAGYLQQTFNGYVQDLQGRGDANITKDMETMFQDNMKDAENDLN
ncbi:hypothetical protein [Numidum massiliense]|uniref:hypothetical protein n=1 Tax=Numidum massiliense TaxID=1522315 RepID=UPI0006D577A4|nr:hypothetical protein [Numidum massiliense]